jgi:hypothetical protein
MTIFGIEFTSSDLVLLGIAGAIALTLIVQHIIGARKNRES